MKNYFIILICFLGRLASKNEIGTKRDSIRFALVPGGLGILMNNSELMLTPATSIYELPFASWGVSATSASILVRTKARR